jgi:hypothetical protein
LGEEAAFGKILCLEAQKQYAQALTLGEAFLRATPDSFLLGEFQVALAEIHLKNKDQAKAAELLEAASKGFPGTYWGREAARRLRDLRS